MISHAEAGLGLRNRDEYLYLYMAQGIVSICMHALSIMHTVQGIRVYTAIFDFVGYSKVNIPSC